MKSMIRIALYLAIVAFAHAQSGKFSVIINTVPYNAQVYINGKEYQKTPCGFNAPKNFKMNVEIRKSGYEVWKQSYLVDRDIDIDITLKPLTERTELKREYPVGFMTLPKGAEVIVDGEIRGITPWAEMFPAGGRLDVVLRKSGHQEWRQTLVVNDAIKKNIKLQSRAITGSKKKYWIIPAIAAVGIGAYMLTTQSDEPAGDDPWPTPPSRPN